MWEKNGMLYFNPVSSWHNKISASQVPRDVIYEEHEVCRSYWHIHLL